MEQFNRKDLDYIINQYVTKSQQFIDLKIDTLSDKVDGVNKHLQEHSNKFEKSWEDIAELKYNEKMKEITCPYKGKIKELDTEQIKKSTIQKFILKSSAIAAGIASILTFLATILIT